jgi:hypothetical protein
MPSHYAKLLRATLTALLMLVAIMALSVSFAPLHAESKDARKYAHVPPSLVEYCKKHTSLSTIDWCITNQWERGLSYSLIERIYAKKLERENWLQRTHWATATGLGNPFFNDGAMVCPDVPTVQFMIQAITHYRGDLFKQQLLGRDSQYLYQPSPEPNLALYGCTIVPSGTRVFVERFVIQFVPLVSTEVNGVTIKGVTLSNMLKFDEKMP